MALLRRQLAYAKIEAEDPEELKHRKARFLIYKALERAEAISRPRQSFLGVRLYTTKAKIGKRLRKPGRRATRILAVARATLFRKISRQFKYLEALVR
ncbi:hypothetical protein MLD38_019402 [Melastoma candidum]|uniref:Uncharacterized protein n=1 Tax=Melastoma candidum TaxID=119954 RepID=A0ACB9QZZ3_9MYRT|nr:hypothetical protein MLD38_019402 [Melastoma candidum]